MIRQKITNKDLKKEDFLLDDDERNYHLRHELIFSLALDVHVIIFLIILFIVPFVIYEYDGSISNLNLFDYFQLRIKNGGINLENNISNIIFLTGIIASALMLLFAFIFVLIDSFGDVLGFTEFKLYKELVYKKYINHPPFGLFRGNSFQPIGAFIIYLIIIAVLVTNVEGIKNAFQIRGFNFTILFPCLSLLPAFFYNVIDSGTRKVLRFDFKNYREREIFYFGVENKETDEKPVVDIKINNLDKKEIVKEKPSAKKGKVQNKETKKIYKKVRETDKKEVNKPKEQVAQKNSIQTKKKTVKDKQASKTAIKKAKTKNK